MSRPGRGNKRRYDDYHGRDTRPARIAWEEDFDHEVRQLKRDAIDNYGGQKGIPVLSFKFISEWKIREAHRALQGGGGGGDLRERIAPRNSSAPAAATAEGTAKRQKKGKETAAAADGSKGAKKEGNAKATEAKPPKEKEDKAATLKRFDDDLDSYFNRAAEQATEPKKEDKPAVVEKSQVKETKETAQAQQG